MYGFPKWLNTKQDVLNMMGINPAETKEVLQHLLDSRFVMTPLHKAEEGETFEPGQEIIPMSTGDMDNPQTEPWVFGPVEDSHAHLFRLGFTVKEAENLIAN